MKNKIREVLTQRGMTQKELSKMIGMSEVGLGKAANGSATQATLGKIAEALKIDIKDLIHEEELHYAKFSAEKTPLRLGDLEIPCYVLENGKRVFSGRGIQRVLGYESKSGQWVKSFCNLEGLSSHIRADKYGIIKAFEEPVKFKRKDAGGSQSATYGYDATLLVDICSAIIDANRAGDFNNKTIVAHADIIIRSVAKVGIIALVDEATGYDKEKTRAKDELQKFLALFLKEEASKWVKTFNDQFFEDIYRMRGWDWTFTNKRPAIVGQYINDIVYKRIGPVLGELERLNPKNVNGNRTHRHFQFLTDGTGIQKLKQHLEAVHALAVVSQYNWDMFMANLDRVYPKKDSELFLDYD